MGNPVYGGVGGSIPPLRRVAYVIAVSIISCLLASDLNVVSNSIFNLIGELNMFNILCAVKFVVVNPVLSFFSAVMASLAANGVTPHLF